MQNYVFVLDTNKAPQNPMKSFNTLNEMVEAYKNQFNAGYSDTSKHFTLEALRKNALVVALLFPRI